MNKLSGNRADPAINALSTLEVIIIDHKYPNRAQRRKSVREQLAALLSLGNHLSKAEKKQVKADLLEVNFPFRNESVHA